MTRLGFEVTEEQGLTRQFGLTCGAVAVNVLERLVCAQDWLTKDVSESVDRVAVYAKYRQLYKPCERRGSKLLTCTNVYTILRENNINVRAECKNLDIFLENLTRDLSGTLRRLVCVHALLILKMERVVGITGLR
eukprot:c25821_g1_i1.p1 GENE.c25821_g1_i1~~c25821_g1_i1.p1  ORF type:complete len:135 (-),score=8.18 c25821_g1_i1:68-472(-)